MNAIMNLSLHCKNCLEVTDFLTKIVVKVKVKRIGQLKRLLLERFANQ